MHPFMIMFANLSSSGATLNVLQKMISERRYSLSHQENSMCIISFNCAIAYSTTLLNISTTLSHFPSSRFLIVSVSMALYFVRFSILTFAVQPHSLDSCPDFPHRQHCFIFHISQSFHQAASSSASWVSRPCEFRRC